MRNNDIVYIGGGLWCIFVFLGVQMLEITASNLGTIINPIIYPIEAILIGMAVFVMALCILNEEKKKKKVVVEKVEIPGIEYQ